MPPRPSPSRHLFRFCASCCATVLCWAVWIVLGISLAILSYIAIARELPVPEFILRRAEARLADAGFALRFGQARFDPTGRVVLENVQLRTRRFEDPLLVCRLLYIRRDFWSILAGRANPDEIRLEGASLQLPAMLSPTGTVEPVMSNLAARLRYDHHAWEIDQFAGRIGSLALTVQGRFALPPAKTPTGKREPVDLTLEAVATQFLKIARTTLPHLQRLDAFAEPSLAITLNERRAEVRFTAASVTQPWGQPVTAGAFLATTTLPLEAPQVRPVRVFFSLGQVDYRHEVRAGDLRGILDAEINPDTFAARALNVQLSSSNVDTRGERFFAPLVRADLKSWPTVHATILTRIEGEFLALEGEAHLREQTARVHAVGRVSPVLVSRLLSQNTPRAAPYFVFDDPIIFDAIAALEPGWKFRSLSTRVEAGRLDSRGVKVTSARGQIDINGLDFLAHDARVTIGDSHARGSYWMNFASTDYRMLLEGRLQPFDIAGWFRGDWWTDFWNRYFDFPGALPEADVDVQGRWKEPSLSNNFIRARGGPARVWGGDFEQITATIFVRPNFVHGWDLEGRRAGGVERVSGWFKRFAPTAERKSGRFEFDFTGNPEPGVVARMLEGRLDDVLATLRFTSIPEMHVWGALEDRPDYRFTGESRTSLHYYGFPLEFARVRGAVKGPDVEISEVTFGAAGGQGRGRASLTGSGDNQRLGFELFVNRANLSRAIHAFEEYDSARDGRPYVATPDSKFVRKAANSSLDVALSAHGSPDDIDTFKGSGNASLTGAELGEVHLFGLLSQAMTGMSLSFSSLKLDAARTSFEVDRGAAFFPDLKVTGPSAVIDARGKYTFATNSLDFNAKFRPYDQPGSLLAAAMSLVLNPLTSMFELKLNGPLGEPKWSFEVTTPGSAPKTPSAPAPSTLAPAPAS